MCGIIGLIGDVCEAGTGELVVRCRQKIPSSWGVARTGFAPFGVRARVPTVCVALLERARDLVIHRGPDQGGLCIAGEAQLAFRRLAILDLSEAGHQPMRSADGQVMLVFNGEIYNFQDLRQKLQDRFPFRSHSDSEVLLNGYLAWGWEELLQRIN